MKQISLPYDIVGGKHGTFWPIPRKLLQVVKTTDAALYLMDLIYIHNQYCKNENFNGIIKRSREHIERYTLLSVKKQRNAENILKSLGFIDIERKGMPATNYTQLHIEKILFIMGMSHNFTLPNTYDEEGSNTSSYDSIVPVKKLAAFNLSSFKTGGNGKSKKVSVVPKGQTSCAERAILKE